VLDASKLRKRFVDAIKRAGVHEITFHELRRTFGTQMAGAGAPLRAVREWPGHADAKTTKIYAHYAPDCLDRRQHENSSPSGVETVPLTSELPRRSVREAMTELCQCSKPNRSHKRTPRGLQTVSLIFRQ
jgi:hypothetical protein